MNHPEYPAWREWLQGLPAGVPFCVGDYLLTPNAAGVLVIQGQLQSDRLIQPFQKAALIDGIRFRAETASPNSGLTTNKDLVPSFQARVWAGGFSLTNDFVSVPALAVREQYVCGEVTNFSGAPGALVPLVH